MFLRMERQRCHCTTRAVNVGSCVSAIGDATFTITVVYRNTMDILDDIRICGG